ncbi:hypothetical protein [Phormidesmis priestleyi]|uniref:hypothetical protein n=1 Tax=Phormidesmis priestleyi TaxID=268141 RepID=UPI00116035FE|nr:hypothetical protein [Phormidesmis priestleyi]
MWSGFWNSDRRWTCCIFMEGDRPIHISYASQHKRNIWAFTAKGLPTRQSIKAWIEQAKMLDSSCLDSFLLS